LGPGGAMCAPRILIRPGQGADVPVLRDRALRPYGPDDAGALLGGQHDHGLISTPSSSRSHPQGWLASAPASWKVMLRYPQLTRPPPGAGICLTRRCPHWTAPRAGADIADRYAGRQRGQPTPALVIATAEAPPDCHANVFAAPHDHGLSNIQL